MPWTGKPSPTQWRSGALWVPRIFLGAFMEEEYGGDPARLNPKPGPSASLRDREAGLHGGPLHEGLEHTLHVAEVLESDQVSRAVEPHEIAHPGERRDVRDRVLAAHDPPARLEPALEH